jgi:hypothetical protein
MDDDGQATSKFFTGGMSFLKKKILKVLAGLMWRGIVLISDSMKAGNFLIWQMSETLLIVFFSSCRLKKMVKVSVK